MLIGKGWWGFDIIPGSVSVSEFLTTSWVRSWVTAAYVWVSENVFWVIFSECIFGISLKNHYLESDRKSRPHKIHIYGWNSWWEVLKYGIMRWKWNKMFIKINWKRKGWKYWKNLDRWENCDKKSKILITTEEKIVNDVSKSKIL